jgi:hypothetical protein
MGLKCECELEASNFQVIVEAMLQEVLNTQVSLGTSAWSQTARQ